MDVIRTSYARHFCFNHAQDKDVLRDHEGRLSLMLSIIPKAGSSQDYQINK